MGIIYEPKGRAKEYCELAANLYSGCEFGCTYCYGPACLHKSREEFVDVRRREGVLEKLKKEAPKYAGREVLLCFTCDPYQPVEDSLKITHRAIGVLHKARVKVVILTKGGLRSMNDFDQLAENKALSSYGATLTFINTAASEKHEPGAAEPQDRLVALEQAHYQGIETWASLEPIIDPDSTLQIIHRTHKFVDHYKLGKLNYSPTNVDWKGFVVDAVKVLEGYGKSYYLKESLLAYL